VILRTGWLCRSDYEWGHHVAIGKQVGLTDEDIKRTGQGPDAPGLEPFEAALLRAADELHKGSRISDATWEVLAGKYNTQQLMDLVFTIGQYHLVSMVLNSLGVQLEAGFDGLSS
ncbi:MAG TPA: carboxymuconolactone decarboxylase family protein, partial [Blastocatellia bacterium]|nr:carboxymuconolactone decarboxylase family protein [Blastocatellia bacterium]